MTRLNVNEAVCEALFASPLQPSDRPTAETVAHAIGNTLRRLGAVGCATHMAQEFGDHPETAIHRMRWARQLTGDFSGRLYFPAAVPPETVATGAGLLPVHESAAEVAWVSADRSPTKREQDVAESRIHSRVAGACQK